MATSLRDLRRKIKSIKSTQKITSAMQLVAASRMQRATKRATDARVYADRIDGLVGSLAHSVDSTSQPLFAQNPTKTILAVLVTTNRGLAGSLNAQLLRRFIEWKRSLPATTTVKVLAVGAKGRQYLLRYMRESLLADFPAPDRVPDYRDVTPINQVILDEFLTQRVDAVYLVYNQFISTLRQEPKIQIFLPLQTKSEEEKVKSKETANDVAFEPDQATVLTQLLPRHLRVQLYQVLLETNASEQSARMLAMKNATDNAGNLIDDLTLTYNSARQAAITGELLDIASGAAALESA